MARLSTHVLDTARGIPAAGIALELHKIEAGRRRPVASATTNTDGRTPSPLWESDTIETGVYELVFFAGAYFRAAGIPLSEPPFLDEVVLRFGVSDARGSYHIPLLLSPYSYSTYRGS